MSRRYGPEPDDEPVIGATIYTPAPPSLPPDEPVIGEGSWLRSPAAGGALPPVYTGEEAGYDDYGGNDYGDDDYDYDSLDAEPARQPLFYVVIGLALILGVAIVYLLFSQFGGDDSPSAPSIGDADFKVLLEGLHNVEAGKETEFVVQATSTDQIVTFELFVDNVSVQRVAAPPPVGNTYSYTFKYTFQQRASHAVKVRVISATNSTRDSNEFKVNVQQGVGAQPVVIKGRALASVSLRTGPGEQFQATGTLPGETEVTILGKTRAGDWLLIQYQGQERWVNRNAIEPGESLALVAVREPTPIPQPTPTTTRDASPTPSVSPSATAAPNAPDFVPVNASLIDGGAVLRVTVANQSPNAFNGSLVLSVTGVNAQPATRAFAVNLRANGSTTVDFDLNPPVTGNATAQVRVDPDNAVKEASEDNNTATFVLTPAVEAPDLVILSTQVIPAAVRVTIRNGGGELKPADIKVEVAVGGQTFSKTEHLAMAKGQTVTIEVVRPPVTGAATLTVLVNGTPVATASVNLQ